LCKFLQGRRGISLKSLDALGKCLNLRLMAEDEPTPKKQKKAR